MNILFKIIIAIFFFAIVIGVYAFGIEPGFLKENKQELTNWTLPSTRIAFFSDLHMGAPHIDRAYVENVVERINNSNPDLILIGGDLVINGVVGGTYAPIEEIADILKKLKAQHGVFAVLGNHDWWRDGDHIFQVLTSSGIKVLENDSQKIYLDEKNYFQLIGIGDHYTRHSNFEKAFQKTKEDETIITFMHDPGALLELKKKFNLAFAGHTHGGQLFIPGFGPIITPGKAPREWVRGWTDLPIGKLFVSVGIGTSIVPFRINTIPEFVILDLKDKNLN